jgi:hypothetical protein
VSLCSGVCVSTASSAKNCGRCGNVCANANSCVDSVCTCVAADNDFFCASTGECLGQVRTRCGPACVNCANTTAPAYAVYVKLGYCATNPVTGLGACVYNGADAGSAAPGVTSP